MQNALQPDDLMTGPEVDAVLKISGMTRWRWEKRGILMPVLIPSRDTPDTYVKRWRRDDVAALVKGAK